MATLLNSCGIVPSYSGLSCCVSVCRHCALVLSSQCTLQTAGLRNQSSIGYTNFKSSSKNKFWLNLKTINMSTKEKTIKEYRKNLSVICGNNIFQRTTLENLQVVPCGCFRILGIIQKISDNQYTVCKSCSIVIDISDGSICKRCNSKCETQLNLTIELKDHTGSAKILIKNSKLLKFARLNMSTENKDDIKIIEKKIRDNVTPLLNTIAEFGVSKRRNSFILLAVDSFMVES